MKLQNLRRWAKMDLRFWRGRGESEARLLAMKVELLKVEVEELLARPVVSIEDLNANMERIDGWAGEVQLRLARLEGSVGAAGNASPEEPRGD